jgi:uncharacterized membrane protein YhaH (DUF805 family)
MILTPPDVNGKISTYLCLYCCYASYRMTVEPTRTLRTIPAFSRSSALHGGAAETDKSTIGALLRTVLSLPYCRDFFCCHLLLLYYTLLLLDFLTFYTRRIHDVHTKGSQPSLLYSEIFILTIVRIPHTVSVTCALVRHGGTEFSQWWWHCQ